MSPSALDPRARAISDAVLYEGYLLFPYRPALKNRRRWTFGELAPGARMRVECLATGRPSSRVRAVIRYLEPIDRGDYVSADAREIATQHAPLDGLVEPRVVEVTLANGTRADVRLDASELEAGVYRVRLEVRNLTSADADSPLATLGSVHAVLSIEPDGAWISAQDPPDALRARVDACSHEGVWPVLVGRPGDHELMLCSPILFEDYPAVARESPGDLFDATENDELLTLSILSLTDDERHEARALDPRAKEIIDRTEALSRDTLERLHGIGVVHAGGGRTFRAGDRVVVRADAPRRADILDIALAGRRATVIETRRDARGEAFVVVAVDGDPGADLAVEAHAIGHRFFFRTDEVDPCPEGE